jgi:glycine cleavage system aminomethyltransferase T
MNRRAFFSAMAGAPVAVVAAAQASPAQFAKGGTVAVPTKRVGELGFEVVISTEQVRRIAREVRARMMCEAITDCMHRFSI